MPTYSYACTECDNRFDAVQAFTEDSLTVCPVCSGKLRKVFSSVGIVFKGSGFYRTDSRAGADMAKAEKAEKSEGTTKTDAAPRTDGAPKTDSAPKKEAGAKKADKPAPAKAPTTS